MFMFIWLPATLAAAAFQVARNALQRDILTTTGPWGATLVRFLFGLPLSLVFLAMAAALTHGADPHFGVVFVIAAIGGALAQVLATAALLVSMRRAGFAVATALQQSSLPMAALIGLALFHDQLGATGWWGVGMATAGLLMLTWPKQAAGPRPLSGALFGLLSGLFFGVSLNAIRHAALALEPRHPIYAAFTCLVVVQTIQTLGLMAWLALSDRRALAAVAAAWRPSLAAGFCGACASAGWFVALALSPAAPVRAVGVVEAPMAALVGRRLFKERVTLGRLLAGLAVMAGVVLTTFR